MAYTTVPGPGKILYKDESFLIQGAVFEVYREIGCGFLESVYQECLSTEFSLRNIPNIAQPEMSISYKGDLLRQAFRPDFVCYSMIIIEIKAVKELIDEHRTQILNYLKVSNYRLGLLVNFGHSPRVEIERFVL